MLPEIVQNEREESQVKLAKGVLVNLFGKAFGRGSHVAGQLILARLLGPFFFGLYGIGWNILRISGILFTLGLDSGVVHFGSKYYKKDRERFSAVILGALFAVFIIGSLAGLAIYLFSSEISQFFNKPELGSILRWFSLAFPALAGARVLASSTRVSKDMMFANLIEEVIQPGSSLLFIGLAYLMGGGILRYVAANSASIILSLFAGIWIVVLRYLVKTISWGELWTNFKELIKYSLPIAIPTVFGSLVILVDRMFVGYFLPEYETGIYQSVSLISVLFVAVLSSFKTIVAPMIAEYYHQENHQGLQRVIKTSTRWAFNICFPVILIILSSPKSFMVSLFGISFLMGADTLLILTVAQLINISKGPIDQLLVMTGNQNIWLKITLISFAVNVAANWLLIPVYGLMGAAYASGLTFICLAVGGLFFSGKKLGFLPYDQYSLRSVIFSILTAAAVFCIKRITIVNPFTELILVAVCSLGIYFCLVGWFGLNDDDKVVIQSYRRNK